MSGKTSCKFNSPIPHSDEWIKALWLAIDTLDIIAWSEKIDRYIVTVNDLFSYLYSFLCFSYYLCLIKIKNKNRPCRIQSEAHLLSNFVITCQCVCRRHMHLPKYLVLEWLNSIIYHRFTIEQKKWLYNFKR